MHGHMLLHFVYLYEKNDETNSLAGWEVTDSYWTVARSVYNKIQMDLYVHHLCQTVLLNTTFKFSYTYTGLWFGDFLPILQSTVWERTYEQDLNGPNCWNHGSILEFRWYTPELV